MCNVLSLFSLSFPIPQKRKETKINNNNKNEQNKPKYENTSRRKYYVSLTPDIWLTSAFSWTLGLKKKKKRKAAPWCFTSVLSIQLARVVSTHSGCSERQPCGLWLPKIRWLSLSTQASLIGNEDQQEQGKAFLKVLDPFHWL